MDTSRSDSTPGRLPGKKEYLTHLSPREAPKASIQQDEESEGSNKIPDPKNIVKSQNRFSFATPGSPTHSAAKRGKILSFKKFYFFLNKS
jgi:hypothetical protein